VLDHTFIPWLTALLFTELRKLLQGCIPDVVDDEPQSVPARKKRPKRVVIDDDDDDTNAKVPGDEGHGSSAMPSEGDSIHPSETEMSDGPLGSMDDSIRGKTVHFIVVQVLIPLPHRL